MTEQDAYFYIVKGNNYNEHEMHQPRKLQEAHPREIKALYKDPNKATEVLSDYTNLSFEKIPCSDYQASKPLEELSNLSQQLHAKNHQMKGLQETIVALRKEIDQWMIAIKERRILTGDQKNLIKEQSEEIRKLKKENDGFVPALEEAMQKQYADVIKSQEETIQEIQADKAGLVKINGIHEVTISELKNALKNTKEKHSDVCHRLREENSEKVECLQEELAMVKDSLESNRFILGKQNEEVRKLNNVIGCKERVIEAHKTGTTLIEEDNKSLIAENLGASAEEKDFQDSMKDQDKKKEEGLESLKTEKITGSLRVSGCY